jgi:ankyrin repeat protein
MKELLDRGADIEAKTTLGSTALHLACSNGKLAVVIELLGPNDSSGATTSILGKRPSRGGAGIEAKTNDGDTPLQNPALMGHVVVARTFSHPTIMDSFLFTMQLI